MPKEMEFFIYLIENYAAYKGKGADEVLNEWDSLNLTDFIYDMYERYHQEAIENAYKDIDELMQEAYEKRK